MSSEKVKMEFVFEVVSGSGHPKMLDCGFSRHFSVQQHVQFFSIVTFFFFGATEEKCHDI